MNTPSTGLSTFLHMHNLTESAWQRIVIAIARVHGWAVGRTSSAHSDPGLPDLTLVHPSGRLIFAELKSDHAAVPAYQRRMLENLRRAGAQAVVWRPADREAVEAVLAGEGPAMPPAPTALVEVLELVAAHYGLDVDDLAGPSRKASVSRARQAAMLIARTVTDASLPAIAEALGGRNHTTVMHGVRAAQERAAHDPTYAQTVDGLCQRLSTGSTPAAPDESRADAQPPTP